MDLNCDVRAMSGAYVGKCRTIRMNEWVQLALRYLFVVAPLPFALEQLANWFLNSLEQMVFISPIRYLSELFRFILKLRENKRLMPRWK